jgi:H+/Cl- antiporter ClcA
MSFTKPYTKGAPESALPLPGAALLSLAGVVIGPLGDLVGMGAGLLTLWLKRAFALSLAIVIADLVLKLLQSASTIASRLRSGLLDPMECA